ncbi:MAG: winged helix-turn-helix domain-containing protein [Candidatus Heimdallarchaeota archaeon]
MVETEKTEGKKIAFIQDEMLITDPDAVPILFHPKKEEILKLLIIREMTIIDLKHATGMNPGTVKRHLTDLLDNHLVFISREKVNEFSIVMKYYRASAKSFQINIIWPQK